MSFSREGGGGYVRSFDTSCVFEKAVQTSSGVHSKRTSLVRGREARAAMFLFFKQAGKVHGEVKRTPL